MYNRSSIGGFTLFEFFMSLVVIAIASGIIAPIVMLIMSSVNLNAYKTDAYSVIEAAKLYVAKSSFDSIPEEGIEISKLNLELKNNNFDSGIIKRKKDDELELVNLKRKNYCATGTTSNMKVTDKGCGALDKSVPKNVRVYIKEMTSNSVTVVGAADDDESEIIGYEFNIDGSKFTKLSKNNEYTFDNLEGDYHIIRVRATNEAGLESISDNIKIKLVNNNHITCYERTESELYQVSKNVVCKFPSGEGYIYEYSLDDNEWNSFEPSNQYYRFNFRDNKTLYIRVRNDKEIISVNTIKVSNIDKTLAGAYPELLDNMIPVVYDETKKAWVKADSRKTYFDYDNKIWANAVYVRRNKDTDDPLSNNREYYLSDNAIGKVVYEKDIIAQYVWIPRFKYKLFNVSDKEKESTLIDILFEGKNIDVIYNNKVGAFLTHKAFTYEDQNGFWASKYQSNVSETSSCYTDLDTCDKKDILIYARKSSKKLTNISIANAHLSTLNMNNNDNIYGISSDNKPHVLTNLEYGAILYLTSSKYGIGNEMYEVSTTGNQTGVFDLNTNNPEMVMGNYNNDAGLNDKNNSGFNNYGEVEWPNYIDIYSGITSKNRILGDATGETKGWFNSYSKFVNGESPFFVRGGVIENKRSIYNYSSTTGAKNELYTFRTAIIK